MVQIVQVHLLALNMAHRVLLCVSGEWRVRFSPCRAAQPPRLHLANVRTSSMLVSDHQGGLWHTVMLRRESAPTAASVEGICSHGCIYGGICFRSCMGHPSRTLLHWEVVKPGMGEPPGHRSGGTVHMSTPRKGVGKRSLRHVSHTLSEVSLLEQSPVVFT